MRRVLVLGNLELSDLLPDLEVVAADTVPETEDEFDLIVLPASLLERAPELRRGGLTPILVLTSQAESLELAAADSLLWPAEPSLLRARVGLLLELARRAREVKQLESELESIVYSVSHDLCAPLRSAEGFLQLVLTGDQELSDKNRKYLGNVTLSLESLERLVSGLLELSRVSRAPLCIEQVNLTALAREVVSELGCDPARVSIQGDLTLPGDRDLLRVVLRHLLDNALKFSSRKEQPRVELGGQNGVSFFVRDNGAGFPPEQAYRLFTPFQRLHHERDFPGTGVGLATVQRILRRHGGSVKAEGSPGQGATFRCAISGNFHPQLPQ
ncbi:hypothetical protein DYH09_00945 [bacterium CPR1]|nr:hypothetical protein [bacterium CPR1]